MSNVLNPNRAMSNVLNPNRAMSNVLLGSMIVNFKRLKALVDWPGGIEAKQAHFLRRGSKQNFKTWEVLFTTES